MKTTILITLIIFITYVFPVIYCYRKTCQLGSGLDLDEEGEGLIGLFKILSFIPVINIFIYFIYIENNSSNEIKSNS